MRAVLASRTRIRIRSLSAVRGPPPLTTQLLLHTIVSSSEFYSIITNYTVEWRLLFNCVETAGSIAMIFAY